MGGFMSAIGKGLGNIVKNRATNWVDRLQSNVGNIKSAFSRDVPSSGPGGTVDQSIARQTESDKTASDANEFGKMIGSSRKGGRIKRTGLYQVHKGEVVIPAEVVSSIEGRNKKRNKARKSGRSSGRR